MVASSVPFPPHSPAARLFGADVVDLSRLRKVTVEPDKRLAFAQGGALWSDFNAATMAHGLASPGGVVSHTGVGGLVVGGGMGYLTGQYGLCIDNLESATVVVASGDIVTASETENADLFWGIRGGGSNFGVVYEFVIRLYPHAGSCFGGFMAFTADKIPGVVAAYRALEPFRPDMAIMVGVAAPEGTTLVIVLPFLDTTDEEEGKEYFKDFYALGPVVDITAIRSYEAQNSFMDPMMPHGPRSYLKGFDYQTVTAPLLTLVVNKHDQFLERLGDGFRGGGIFFESYPYNAIIQHASDSTAYANRGAHFNCTISVRWADESMDDWVRDWIHELVADSRDIEAQAMTAEGKEKTVDGAYVNFCLPGEKVEMAFRENLPKLIEVKRKWDPKGRFDKWFAIPT
jgi:hypothetical protein